MQVITIESEAFQQILNRLEEISHKLKESHPKGPLKEVWLDNQEVCQLLHISKRLLQSYRDSGKLPYSQIGAKLYYRADDIETFLSLHYKSNNK